MRLFFLTFAALGLLSGPAMGGQTDDVSIKVNGLVCDFCARAVEKVFSKREEVESVHIDLASHLVTIGLKDGMTIADDDITKMITDSGYNVVEIMRAP